MNIIRADAHLVDAKIDKPARTRHILANSGDIMESGEIRPIGNLYVMGRDAKLIKIAELNKDPNKQTEEYSVKAQADHGEYDAATGELIPTVEKCFGSCRVWLEDDGLHALMSFAEGDKLADHCWAISKDASYSTGMDIYPDGYYGAGQEIDGTVAILREISMVLTGNDPRARTIDQKPAEAQAQRSAEAGDGKNINKGEAEVPTQKDNLTPDEAVAMKEQLLEVVNETEAAKVAEIVDNFTTEAPESETEPTEDAKDDAPEAPATETETPAEAEAPAKEAEEEKETKEEEKDMLHMPATVIKDSAVKQELKATDAVAKAKQTVADAITASRGKFDARFNDKITGLTDPCGFAAAFENELEQSKGLINHFMKINAKSFKAQIVTGEGDLSRAGGHKKGDTKKDQEVKNVVRDILCKMAYKRLGFDALELYNNPELLGFRVKELAASIITEIERAAFSGDGREEGTPDRRMYDGVHGFRSIAADAAAVLTDGFSKAVAAVYEKPTEEDFAQAVAGAQGLIFAEGAQILVTKKANIIGLKKAVDKNGRRLIEGDIKEYLGVDYIYTPRWMDEDKTNEAYLVVDGAYAMIGESDIRSIADFDVNTNEDVLLDETPRGGALIKAHSAVAIKNAA